MVTLRRHGIALMAAAALTLGCTQQSSDAYAGQVLQLTTEQIKAMSPEQLQAVFMAQQQTAMQPQTLAPGVMPSQPLPAQAAAPAPAAEAPKEGMDPLAAGLLGAAGGALAGGLIGNSMGKTSATADAALANSARSPGYAPSYQRQYPSTYRQQPRTVVNKTTIVKQYVTPAPAQRVSVGQTKSRPMAVPKVPSMSKTYRATSSRRR